jgi:pseudouridine kinase
VVCIGGANVDKKAICKTLILGTSNPVCFRFSAGGVARNVAENLARLGLKASLLSFVGEDHEADWLLEQCQSLGIDVSLTRRISAARTGTYLGVLDGRGELHLGLADMEIYDQIEEDAVFCHWEHLRTAPLVFADTNLSPPVLESLITRAREETFRLVLDGVSIAKIVKLPANLEGVSLLVANLDEASALYHALPTSEAWEDYHGLGQGLLQRGLHELVITLGPEGVFYMGPSGEGQLEAPAASVVDVTGAGDSFTAGLIFGLLQGADLASAVHWGQRIAKITIESPETVSPRLSPHVLADALKES